MCLFMLIATCIGVDDSATLTVTEMLIKNRIVSLGGEWDRPTSPEMVTAIGKKFSEREFEMFSHLTRTKKLCLYDTMITSAAIEHVGRMQGLAFLEIDAPELAPSVSFRPLNELEQLRRVRLSHFDLDAEMLTTIVKLPGVKQLEFDDCGLPSNAAQVLHEVSKQVESVYISTDRDFSEAELTTLKDHLGNVKLELHTNQTPYWRIQ